MSIENTAPEPIQERLQPITDGAFRFACHPGVPCFTECCRDLNLLLTPYDVVRLKNHLGLDAESFLDQYTDMRFDDRQGLPMIYLRMLANERKTCPFVSPQGCLVYPDRPAACRTYPLARASRKHRLHGAVLENYYILHESHCRGFAEERPWTVEEWVQDQDLAPFHEMNNPWMEIVTGFRQPGALSEKQRQMFHMASYNMDQFRLFIFGSRFLEIFRFDPEEIEAMRNDDTALLRVGFRWLQFSLFNEPVLERR